MNTQLQSDPGLYTQRLRGLVPGIDITRQRVERMDEALTAPALQLLAFLHRRFNARRLELLAAREHRQAALDAGALPDFLAQTRAVRDGDWRIGPVPSDLNNRRVEVVGPVDRRTIIQALNAPVSAFIADFEDTCTPGWENLITGQVALSDAIRRRIVYSDATSGKLYRVRDKAPALIVRPRGWHLPEKHVRVDGEAVCGALFDFALYLANNHEELARNGTGPYFYLPKLESHLEARLWNEVFIAASEHSGIARGTIKATVLIETLPAAFEMDEILFELREHVTALSFGRWDYVFSYIKKFRNRANAVVPDRAAITMDKPFLKSGVDLMIRTCHRRAAHAIGGMAAQVPLRGDPQANAAATANVRADKLREARAGHDGSWIAHPGLAPVANEVFDAIMPGPNQLNVLRPDVNVSAADLLKAPQGAITEAGLRHNIRVGLRYVESWLSGSGQVALYHLMEHTASAEICRAQLWQWLRHGARTGDGKAITVERFEHCLVEEIERIHREVGGARMLAGVFPTAARLFADMVTSEAFDEFLTLPAYELLG